MKKHIELLGSMIEKQVPESPAAARKLLCAAYSWVRFSGEHHPGHTLQTAYGQMNAAIAGTIVDSFRHPENSVMVNIFFPCELLHVMGIQPMFPEGLSVYLACTDCQRVFAEAAEEHDVPESYCSYHKTLLGAAETGVMPKPLIIANTTIACDANQLTFRRLADFYQVPHAVIDVPREDSEDAVRYVADQLRTFAAQLEDLCHKKLDEEALKETVACSRRTAEAYRTFLARRGSISLPATMTGELCTMLSGHVMMGRPESERYMAHLLKIAEAAPKRPEKGKRRIFWMHVLPNWQDSIRQILETNSRCELVGTDMSADILHEMDPEKPFESMARRVTGSIFNGPARRRIEAALQRAKEAKADGVILFCHWGCKQTLGLSQMAKQVMEAAGLPTLVLDGDGCDARNVADGQMVTRVNAFLEQLEGVCA